MNDGICSQCKFVAEAYSGSWQWCNKYLCKAEDVKSCQVDQPKVFDNNPP